MNAVSKSLRISRKNLALMGCLALVLVLALSSFAPAVSAQTPTPTPTATALPTPTATGVWLDPKSFQTRLPLLLNACCLHFKRW